MSAETAAAIKASQIVMTGAIWVAPDAPGAREYMTFYKSAVDSNLLHAIFGLGGRQPSGGLDRLLEAVAASPGLPYLTDITMTMRGAVRSWRPPSSSARCV